MGLIVENVGKFLARYGSLLGAEELDLFSSSRDFEVHIFFSHAIVSDGVMRLSLTVPLLWLNLTSASLAGQVLCGEA